MKILLILPSLALGGAEVSTAKMAIHLKKLGADVTILTFVHLDTQIFQLLKNNNIGIVVTNKTPKKHKYYSFSNMLFLHRYLKNNDFDIVHAQLFPAQLSLACVKLVSKHNIPFITSEHSTNNRRRNKWFFKPIDYLVYKQFDKIITISPTVEVELTNWVPHIKERCEVILNGVNIEEFQNKKNTNHSDAQKQNLYVLSVGRFFPPKGHYILLKAFALTSGMELYLAGDGPLKDELLKLAEELKIKDRIHFLGIRSDIPELINNADIYVQPSLWEGVCIANLEAMAGGLPVIVSDVAGLSEVVEDSGLKFPRGDHVKLAECLTLLKEDKALRDKLSAMSQERAKDFSLEKTVKQYYALYEKCIASCEKSNAK